MKQVQIMAAKISQAGAIRGACGSPCVYDYVLHTETLDTDWHSLLLKVREPCYICYHMPEHNQSTTKAHRLPNMAGERHAVRAAALQPFEEDEPAGRAAAAHRPRQGHTQCTTCTHRAPSLGALLIYC